MKTDDSQSLYSLYSLLDFVEKKGALLDVVSQVIKGGRALWQ